LLALRRRPALVGVAAASDRAALPAFIAASVLARVEVIFVLTVQR
jgi:hypothetical protein